LLTSRLFHVELELMHVVWDVAERVATYVIRAMMYHDKFQQRKYYEVFEILETAGFALLIVILWHLWSAFGTKKEDGSTKKLIRSCNCLFQLLATIITAGGGPTTPSPLDRHQTRHNTREYASSYDRVVCLQLVSTGR